MPYANKPVTIGDAMLACCIAAPNYGFNQAYAKIG
jgi:hypothetical protein